MSTTISPINKEILSEKIKKDAWRHSLRKNCVLDWVDDLENVMQYSDILNTCSTNSVLEIESGIVKIMPKGRYIGHRFVPYINAGFTFLEIAILLKSKIIEFEAEYGKVNLTERDLYDLRQLVYQYNNQYVSVNMSNKKKLIHLEQSGEVLYYLLSSKIIFEPHVNGWCSLTFINNSYSHKDYCTIFTEEQIDLLDRVSKAISDRDVERK